jgi:predicted GNAT superfamily acetyltransferase
VEPERVTKADFDEIVDRLPAFWGERDLSGLHHPMFVHEFGDSAFLIRDEHGSVAAYLLGFVLPAQALAYVHLVAVRDDQRGKGLARLLYERFQRLAGERGCDRIKAITTPGNAVSIAFHRAMGMDAVDVPDYAGPGRARVVFSAPLEE